VSLLLDSHALLWWSEDNPKIGPVVLATLADPKTRVLVSAASIWEIGIKQALGKLHTPKSILDLLPEEGFETLPITARHAETAARLPLPVCRCPSAAAALGSLRPHAGGTGPPGEAYIGDP